MNNSKELWLRVPASSANLGAGFDALSIAIALYLEVRVVLSHSNDVNDGNDGNDGNDVNDDGKHITVHYEGVNPDKVDVSVEANLITKTVSKTVKYQLNTTQRSKKENKRNITKNITINLTKNITKL